MACDIRRTNDSRYTVRVYQDCAVAELVDNRKCKAVIKGTIRDITNYMNMLGLKVVAQC